VRAHLLSRPCLHSCLPRSKSKSTTIIVTNNGPSHPPQPAPQPTQQTVIVNGGQAQPAGQPVYVGAPPPAAEKSSAPPPAYSSSDKRTMRTKRQESNYSRSDAAASIRQ
jgi:hypothetical protein